MSRLLEQRVEAGWAGSFRVRVETSEKLEEDYETGMISLALKRIVEGYGCAAGQGSKALKEL